MAQQTIDLGKTANDGTGSTLRVGGDMINDNFTELYAAKNAAAYYTGDYNFVSTPTSAEIIAVLGAATLYNAGSVFILNDTAGEIFYVMSNGTTWFVNSATFTAAL